MCAFLRDWREPSRRRRIRRICFQQPSASVNADLKLRQGCYETPDTDGGLGNHTIQAWWWKQEGHGGGGGQRLSLSSCRKVWEVKVKEVNDLLVAPGWTGLHAGTVGVQSGVPLQKRRKASSLHHRLTTTMMDKVRKQKIKKSICLTFKEFLYKLCQ